MTERQADILKAIIEEYIADAQPIGSKTLVEKYDFGIGPAMIRQEMVALEKNGYLAQPHVSAGRVPTDEAYRLYISTELARQKPTLATKEQQEIKEALRSSGDERELLRDTSRVAAEISRDLSVAGLVEGELFFTHGFAQLMSEPELQEVANIQPLLQFIDEIDQRFNVLWRHMLKSETVIFVGEENPIREIQGFTLITGRFNLPVTGRSGEKKGFVSLLGPCRMDYRKNVALVNYISELIGNLKP